MALDDVYEVALHFEFQDNPNVYLFHLREDGPGAGGVEDALNTFFDATIIPFMLPWTSDKLEFVCLETRRILNALVKDPVSSLPKQKSISTTGTQTSPLEPLPGQCSLVIQLLNDPDMIDAKRRGRDFWTGLMESDQDNGTWLQASVDIVTAALKLMFPQPFILPGGESMIWGVFSSTLLAQRKAQDPATPMIDWIDPFSLITVMRPLQQVRTQRRRQPDNPCKLYYPSVDIP